MGQTKLIVGLLLALALGVAVAMFGGHYTRLQHAAAQNEGRGLVLENTSAGVADGVDNDQAQAQVDTGLAQGRDTFKTSINEAKRHDPETANRADRVVPERVRNAYRERRLARERLGCAGRECAKDDNADTATQR
jgi:hypothetical protein